MSKKILILGHARHGKDTLAQIIRDSVGLQCESTSMIAAKNFIFDKLKELYNYSSIEECWMDRVNHREEWYNLICNFNKEDRSAFVKSVMKTNDIYVGLRSKDELDQCKRENIFDYIIGVYDSTKPKESIKSFNIDIFKECELIVCTNSSLEKLKKVVKMLIEGII